jgi:ubiquinone/menaquinone biosynthesis C-methylase UbiE
MYIQFDQGFADDLPCADRSFDRVFSIFMYHHLPGNEKVKTLQEARHVLKNGGELHLLDFAPDDRSHGLPARLFHTNQRLKHNSQTRVLSFIHQAGFPSAEKLERRTMLVGGVAYYPARA